MSLTFRVEVCMVDSIEPHPNGDRIEFAIIKGWSCIVPKGQYKPGDVVVFIPPEAVLPPEFIERFDVTYLKNKHGRVGVVKLRGYYSYGVVVPNKDNKPLGKDVAKYYGIEKWEEVKKQFRTSGKGNLKAGKHKGNLFFKKYRDIEHLRNFPGAIREGDKVVITEKIHGTNFRAGYVPVNPRNIFQRFYYWVTHKGHEFCYGSRTVQLNNKMFYKGYYDANVYAKICKKYDLENVLLEENLILYGEIYGPGIQKGYSYGLEEIDVVFFEVRKDGEYLPPGIAWKVLNSYNLPTVPVLYAGDYTPEIIEKYLTGVSKIDNHTAKEGIVVRKLDNALIPGVGKPIFRVLSPEYLAQKERTEFH